MAEQKTKQKDLLREVKINALSFIGTHLSQISTVTVTDTDVTIDFVYLHPNENVTEGQVVTRVTLPKNSAMQLAKAINETLNKHESKNTKQN